MLTFSELYTTALPGTKAPLSARALCGVYKTRGLDFRTIATAVGSRKCAIQVQLLSPSILRSTNFAADVKLPSSRPTIAQIQSLNAKLTPQGLSLKLVSKDLSQAVLVGTWDAVANLTVGAYSTSSLPGPNTEVKIGDGLMWIGAVVVGYGLTTAAVDFGSTIAIGGLIAVLGFALTLQGGDRLDNPPPPQAPPPTPIEPTPVTNSTSHDTVDQDDDSGPAQDPATCQTARSSASCPTASAQTKWSTPSQTNSASETPPGGAAATRAASSLEASETAATRPVAAASSVAAGPAASSDRSCGAFVAQRAASRRALGFSGTLKRLGLLV